MNALLPLETYVCGFMYRLNKKSWSVSNTGTSGNAFHDACKRGNLELLEECLANKIPVNVPDKAGNTGLHW